MSNNQTVKANSIVDLSNNQPERNLSIQTDFVDNTIAINVDGTKYLVPCTLTHFKNGRKVPVGQRQTSKIKSGGKYKFDVTETGTTLEMKLGNERTIARWAPDQMASMRTS